MAVVRLGLLLWAAMVPLVLGRIVITAVLPHGDFAYDPSLVHNQNGSTMVHTAALRVAHAVHDTTPDIIMLSTPHGLASDREFLLYANTNGSGHADIGQDLHNR